MKDDKTRKKNISLSGDCPPLLKHSMIDLKVSCCCLRKINLRFLAGGICRIIDDTLRAHICTTVATDRNISSRVKISKYKISRMHSRSTFARRALSYSFNLSSTLNSPRERFTISVHLTQKNLPFTFIFSLFLLIVRKIS